MSRSLMKSLTAMTLAICLMCMSSMVRAEEAEAPEDVSAEAIAVDTLFLRPIGFAATLVGTAIFIISLPFSLPTKSAEKAAKKLVVAPAKYTFARPLGHGLN